MASAALWKIVLSSVGGNGLMEEQAAFLPWQKSLQNATTTIAVTLNTGNDIKIYAN